MDRQLVAEPEGDGEAVLDVAAGFANPLRLAACSAASHLPRPAGRWRMPEILHLSTAKGEVDRQLVAEPEGEGEAVLNVFDRFANHHLRPRATVRLRPEGWLAERCAFSGT